MIKLPKGLQDIRAMTKAEMLELLLREEYGYLPPAPRSVRYETVSRDDRFCAGKASLIRLRVTCETEQGSFSFPVAYTRPRKLPEPMPCFIHINFRDLVPDSYQPSEELVDGGVAVLSFCYKDVTSDDGDFGTGLAGVVYPNGRTEPTQCGKIGLWAWAARCVLEFALTLPAIDPRRISVVGHSRLGKTALLAGALDERFFCAYSNDSGCGGAALARGNTGETVEKITGNFPFWFCRRYLSYVGREEEMPYDQHFLLAANAPHRVYVASASEDAWACPQNEHLSAVAASTYYEAQGLCGLTDKTPVLPAVGTSIHGGCVAYHLRRGPHYLGREDWNRFIDYLEIEYTKC